MPNTLPLITLALLASFALSLSLLRRSLRGRRTGDHPFCSRCSFDLFNRPETSTHCPECGQTFSNPRAILAGIRRRSPAFIFFSLTLLLLSIATTLTFSYRLITDPKLIPLQPTAFLPLHFRDGPLSTYALAELQSRILSHRAPISSASSVISKILSLQSNPAAQWNPVHGTFIESLRQSSLLSDPDWTTYLQHSSTITARIRPNIRLGDPVPIELTITSRVGSNSFIRAVCSGSITFDNQPPIGLSPWGNPWFRLASFSKFPIYHSAPPSEYADLCPGPHIAHISAELALSLAFDPPLKLRQSFALPFVLHPANEPTVRIINDPNLREKIAHSIAILVLSLGSSHSQPAFFFFAPSSPCALSYDVQFRSNSTEFGRSPLTIAQGSRGGQVVRAPFPSHLPDHIDLILHPNPTYAANSVDITEICAGAIFLTNVSTAPSSGSPTTPFLPPLPTTHPNTPPN